MALIPKREIESRLEKVSGEIKKKISMIHLGAIKILVKAQFRDGIDTPLKMALIDNRINNRTDCLLGAAKGNLAYGKFMFTVYPKFGVSLQTKNLDQVLSFIHKFERTDLMNEGDKIFSITYLIGYALTNSHHSIDYKQKINIELEDVFSDIGNIKDSQFCDLSPTDNEWAKEKRYFGQKPKPFVKKNQLIISDSGLSALQDKDDLSIRTISKKIDNIQQVLSQLQNLQQD